MPYELEAHL